MPIRNHLEKIFPLTFVFLSVIIFTPIFGSTLPHPTAGIIHALSYLTLGLFFELPELSLNIFCFWLSRTEQSLAEKFSLFKAVIRIRYLLTHFVAPCSGIMVIASGLYLVHVGGHSFREAWIFWIIVASTIGLYKGITQHNFYVKYLLQLVNSDDGKDIRSTKVERIQYVMHSPFDHSLIFLEFPTYAFSYWAAYFKPTWVNPFDSLLMSLEHILGTPALVGVLLVCAGCLLIMPLRWSMKKFSRIFV